MNISKILESYLIYPKIDSDERLKAEKLYDAIDSQTTAASTEIFTQKQDFWFYPPYANNDLKVKETKFNTDLLYNDDPAELEEHRELSESDRLELSKKYSSQMKKIGEIQKDSNPKQLNILLLCKMVQEQRFERCKEAAEQGTNLYFRAEKLNLQYSLQFNMDKTVIVHFTKSKNNKTYGRTNCPKVTADKVVVKTCIDFDSCKEYASMSSPALFFKKRLQMFEVVKDLKHFAQLQYITEIYNSTFEQEKVRFVLTLGKLDNLSHPRWYNAPIQTRHQIAHDIINGVESLHKKGYGHFDVSPVNVVIDEQQSALLIDLENARPLDKVDQNPPPLKVDYAHPRMLKVSANKEDLIETYSMVDIWCLGYTLYELYFDDLPWKEITTISEKVKIQKSDWFPEPSKDTLWAHLIWEMVQDTPPTFSQILSRINACFPIEK